jgi:hypothetical protein
MEDHRVMNSFFGAPIFGLQRVSVLMPTSKNY